MRLYKTDNISDTFKLNAIGSWIFVDTLCISILYTFWLQKEEFCVLLRNWNRIELEILEKCKFPFRIR